MPIQVNGKLRGQIEVQKDLSPSDIEKLALADICSKSIEGKQTKEDNRCAG